MDEAPPVKPGIWTTEWWSLLLLKLVTAGLGLGWYASDDANKLTAAIPVVVGLIASVVGYWRYTTSRTELKKAALNPTVRVLGRKQ